MSKKDQEKPLNSQLEPGFVDRAVEKAKEAEARARRASELAKEAAVKAKESAHKSAQTTKELAQEAKRKARGAQIAAQKVKKEVKLAARMVKEAKEAENRATNHNGTTNAEKTNTIATANGIAEKAKANLANEFDLESTGRLDKEVGSVERETKLLNSEQLDGRVNILLKLHNAQQMSSIEKALRSEQKLKVILVTGSVDGIGRIVVLAEQPIPLIDMLSQIPVVDEVTQIGWREIQLSLKRQ